MPAVVGPAGQTSQLCAVGSDEAQIGLVAIEDCLKEDPAGPVHRWFGRCWDGSRLLSILSFANILLCRVEVGFRGQRVGSRPEQQRRGRQQDDPTPKPDARGGRFLAIDLRCRPSSCGLGCHVSPPPSCRLDQQHGSWRWTHAALHGGNAMQPPESAAQVWPVGAPMDVNPWSS
jgi:hypothetical protein